MHLATVITSVAEGTFVEPSKQPLARFLVGEWLPAIRGSVRPLTAERYAKTVRLYVTSREIGTVPLRGLSGGHLTGLYSDLEREGLSVATRRLTHSVLRRALNDAVPGTSSRATLRTPPTLRGHHATGRNRGRPMSCARSWRTLRTTAWPPSGGSRPRRGCAAASCSG
jgi:hypothetical protein